MGFHTVAYTASIGSGAGQSFLTAVVDTVFSQSGTTGFLLPGDLKLIAGYAAAAGISRARVNAPSLLRVGFCSIRPLQQNSVAASGQPTANPNFMTLIDNPLTLRAAEPVGVEAATVNSTAERFIATLWFCDRLDPVPPGDSFWLRFTSTTTGNAVANAWTVFAPTFDQSIPSGTYAVIGAECTSASSVAARIVFPGQVYRPGIVAQPGAVGASRTHRYFYDGSFGVFGTFQTFAPPNIEILATGTEALNTIEGYMRVVRIGDIGMVKPLCPTPGAPPQSPSSLPGG
jgi:hypothetical protein